MDRQADRNSSHSLATDASPLAARSSSEIHSHSTAGSLPREPLLTAETGAGAELGSPRERSQLPAGFQESKRNAQWPNGTRAVHSHDPLLHELFEQQVRCTPDSVALVCDGGSLTYSALNAAANQLAWYLRSRHVSSDQLVGICVERSLEMLVGLLG